MRTRVNLLLSPLIFASSLLIACGRPVQSTTQTHTLTDRDRDGLIGIVKAVLTDDVILEEQNGQWVEIQQASSVSIYNEAGKRTLQTPFRVNLPNGYALTQHEILFDPNVKEGSLVKLNAIENKYVEHDIKGNVIETGRYQDQVRSPEVSIKYEFDSGGNWIKRTISRLTQKGGQSVLQPAEAGYRQIIYFNAGVRSAESRQDGLVPASAKQMKSPVALTAANIASGRSLFNQKCIACHGENGKSQTEFSSFMTVNPVDLTGPKARALTEGEVFSIIVNGAGSSGMPAFKGRVSDESLWQITLYVKQMSRPQTTGNQNTIVAAPSSPPTQKAPAAAEQRYQLKGKVVSIDRESQEVMIEHEEIANYMGAMTMPFPLKDRNVLGKLKKDDLIEATLVVDRNGWRLENVVIK